MSDAIDTQQGVLFYTEADMLAKVAEMEQEFTRRSISENAHQNTRASNAVVEVLKSEVAEGNITLEYANSLYDLFCDNAGFIRQVIKNTYTVTVSVDGNVIASFSEVEASDEDDACDIVRDNLETEDIEVNLTLSYEGQTEYGSYSASVYTMELDFEFSAEAE